MTEILNYPKCYKHSGGEYFLPLLTVSSESTTTPANIFRAAELSDYRSTVTPLSTCRCRESLNTDADQARQMVTITMWLSLHLFTRKHNYQLLYFLWRIPSNCDLSCALVFLRWSISSAWAFSSACLLSIAFFSTIWHWTWRSLT